MGFVAGLGVLAACMAGGAGVLLVLGLDIQALGLPPDVDSWLWLLAMPALVASAWAVMRAFSLIVRRRQPPRGPGRAPG